MTAIRLQKYLAECGLGSRRHCEDLIAQGRVTVNGLPGAAGQAVDPAHDAVALDGEALERVPAVYILLNKPKGAVTSARDDDDRGTVFDYLEGVETRLFPAGRLDIEVEGALILTNDGGLVHRMTEPGRGVERVYIATVRGIVNEGTVQRMGEGIQLEDGATVRARARILHTGVDSTVLRIALHERGHGRVRHLGAVVGHPVLELRRIAEAGIELSGLEPGQWRELTPGEIDSLRTHAGTAPAPKK